MLPNAVGRLMATGQFYTPSERTSEAVLKSTPVSLVGSRSEIQVGLLFAQSRGQISSPKIILNTIPGLPNDHWALLQSNKQHSHAPPEAFLDRRQSERDGCEQML